MARKKPWIGSSWKMTKTRAEARDLARVLSAEAPSRAGQARLFVIPSFTAIAEVAEILRDSGVAVGAQNMHWADKGPWTGEVSAPMIKECGVTLVELGHSERRTFFGETDVAVGLKTAAALRHGLIPLVCIGDTRADYDAGRTAEILEGQVRAALSGVADAPPGQILFAYEPVWSIGEGGTPADPDFADEQHRMIKATIADCLAGRELDVLYGGSVNPANCRALASKPHVDGLFIGRSAWTTPGFLGIIDDVIGRS